MNPISATAIVGNVVELLTQMPMIGKRPISLYVHIPFCSRKCDYCHFYVLPDREPFKIQLLEGLKLEWEHIRPLLIGKKIETLYFGGGTPYLLGPSAIAEMIRWFTSGMTNDELRSLEVTLEANPENIERHSLTEFHAAGINRLSIGLQSLDENQLQMLSRRHSAQKGIEAVELASSVGFSNISVDLMYDLPGQSLESWKQTVERAVRLPITHLSLYNLTIEPHTVFFKYRESLSKQLPDEETSKAMYDLACSTFEGAGLAQYEISAFAKNGLTARHNSGYWTGRPFLGLGPSAFSYWEGSRFRNISNLSKYLETLRSGGSPIDFTEKLALEAHQRELLTIALRLLNGVDLVSFQQQEGLISPECRQTLHELEKDGFLQHNENHWALTRKGVLFYDTVAIELV
jgi:oxygen-independent coproporphyrinogen III oxidase